MSAVGGMKTKGDSVTFSGTVFAERCWPEELRGQQGPIEEWLAGRAE